MPLVSKPEIIYIVKTLLIDSSSVFGGCLELNFDKINLQDSIYLSHTFLIYLQINYHQITAELSIFRIGSHSVLTRFHSLVT